MKPEEIEKEREEFEKHITSSWVYDYKHRLKNGEYAYDHIKFAWKLWLIRAELAMKGSQNE
jgi:hypothetical protein